MQTKVWPRDPWVWISPLYELFVSGPSWGLEVTRCVAVLPKVIGFVSVWHVIMTREVSSCPVHIFFSLFLRENPCLPFPHPHQSNFVYHKLVTLK